MLFSADLNFFVGSSVSCNLLQPLNFECVGIKCNCVDPSVSKKCNGFQEMECPLDGSGKVQGTCYKFVAGDLVFKGCGRGPRGNETTEIGCKDVKGVTECVCDTDLCNQGSLLFSFSFLQVIVFISVPTLLLHVLKNIK